MDRQKKHIITGLCILFIFLTFRGVFAAGTCGTNVAYTIDENMISFSKGDGAEDPVWGADCGEVFKDNAEITSVKVTEKISLTNGNRLFMDFMYVREMDLSNLDISNLVADMKNMFTGCSSLESLDLSGWDTSFVTDMRDMFRGCGSLENLDLSGWDTSNVMDMDCMFQECESLTSLDLSGWDTSRVTHMANMFYHCKSLESLDLSGWDTSRVTYMNFMFFECHSLTSLDLSSWDTSNVEHMDGMFDSCDFLNTLALGKNTVRTNIFNTRLLAYESNWIYYKAGADAEDPLPLQTVKTGSELFGSYDCGKMAGVWSTDEYLALAESLTIEYPAETDVTGRTIIVDSPEIQLSAFASPGNGQNFFWHSEDPGTAVVDADGKVTFKKAGTVTITVKAADGSGVSSGVTLTYVPASETPPSVPETPEPNPECCRICCPGCQLPATGFTAARPAPLTAQPKELNCRPVPMRLQIPSLELETELVTVPLKDKTWQVEWLGGRAGILDGTALPGEGISVIAAHNTLGSADFGPFALLYTLDVNDTVMVRDEKGTLKLFRVYANELLAPDDMEKLASIAGREKNTIVLVTCENESAEGGYLNRRAVFAAQK